MSTAPAVLDFVEEIPIATAGDTLGNPPAGRAYLFKSGAFWYSKSSAGVVAALQGVPTSRQVIAGSGLTGGGALTGDITIDLNVDNSSLEVIADLARVKALGITNAMLAGSIAYSKLSLANSILNADLFGGIALSKLATDPLARANHTGTQLAATISDFNTAVRLNRLDQMAVPGADVNYGGFGITGARDGVVLTDYVTLGQLSAVVNSQQWKTTPADAMTTGALPACTYANGTSGVGATLTGNANGALPSNDGVAPVAGESLLVKDQIAGLQNGIYTITTVGTGGTPFVLTRRTDADTVAKLTDATVLVDNGSTGKGDIYTFPTITTMGTTDATPAKTGEGNTIYGADGTTIQLSGQTFSIINGGVGPTQLSAAVAGAGLTGGAGTALNVIGNADGTIIVNANDIQVGALIAANIPALLITNGMLAGSINYGKLNLNNSIVNADLVGSIALTKLATQAANTVLANNTGGVAAPTAITYPTLKTALAIVDSDVDYTESASQVVGSQANFNINLNRYLFNLLNYIGSGFVADNGDGTTGTDVGAPMNTILGILATAKGGKIVIPGGLLMRQTTPIVVNGNGIEIVGGGCGYTADTGNWRDALGTAFVWRGSSGQIQMDVFPSGTGGVGQNLKGFLLEGVTFEGRDNRTVGGDVGSTRADKGLRLRSCAGFHVRDIFVEDCVTAHIEMGALANGTIGEAHDCARGILERFCIRALDNGGAGGAVAPGTGIVMGGTTLANTNFCEIKTGQISYNGANTGKPAIDLVNTDSNLFSTISINNSASPATSNWGIVVRGGATAAEASRANLFYNVSAGSNGMILCGTAAGQRPDGTADATFNFTAASGNNLIDLNTENGEPYPFVGTGVIGPSPGASGGSTFPTQGFRCGTAALKTAGAIAAITTAEVRMIGMTVPKWFLYAGRQIRFRASGVLSSAVTTQSTFTFRIRVGTTTLTGNVAGVFTLLSGSLAHANVPFMIDAILQIPTAGSGGTAIAQLWSPLLVGGTPAAVGNMVTEVAAGVTTAVAVNTLIANEIEMTGIGATGTPSFTIQMASIEAVN